MILATRPFGSVTLYSQARARDQSRDASPPSRVTIVAAYCFCPVRASVRSRPQRGSLHDGVRRGEVVQAHSTCLTPHRDRNGLTFPTSSAEQTATPERSLNGARGGRLAEAEVRAVQPHTVHNDS